jgi:hypothetical protein
VQKINSHAKTDMNQNSIFLLAMILSCAHCTTKRCQPPKEIARDLAIIESLAENILQQKGLLVAQNQEIQGRFTCGKTPSGSPLFQIDSTCIANHITGFYVGEQNNITFYLQEESNFFNGITIDRTLYFSNTPPVTTYDDHQIRNLCQQQLSDRIWYIEDEIHN